MTDITIPPEALEAAARELTMALILAVDEDCRACALTDDERMEVARAACLAMIQSWPGMGKHTVQVPDDSEEVRYTLKTVGIILPFQENGNG